MSSPVAALVVGVAATLVPQRRVPPAVAVGAVTVAALVLGVVPVAALGDAADALAAPLAFLVVAVPLAVALDEAGFFTALAAAVGTGRRMRAGLWLLAAAVTVLFNLDAAVVLLTPLYVRIAVRRGDDPVALAFIPALMASLVSTVLPVSNLTNLVVAEEAGVGTVDFLRNAAAPAIAATVVGWFAYRRAFTDSESLTAGDTAGDTNADGGEDAGFDRRPLLVGLPVVAWLLVGFTVGAELGVPAWVVGAVALAALAAVNRSLPWRAVPVQPALLALALGTLALAAAPSLRVERVFAVDGLRGEAAVFGAAAFGANVMNNLPATVVSLPALEAHPERVWALLLGVNLGPLLWVSGALSTLLWQSTLARLGHRVDARRYVAVGWRVGIPALATALAVRLALAA